METLIRLQALSLVAKFDSQKEKIIFLRRAGMQNKEIAEILGTTSNTVNVTLVNARKAEQKKQSKEIEEE